MTVRRGVYFLANDYVLDRAIAFLNSFRAHHESLPLCLIPFADDIDDVLKLQSRFDFSVWSGDPAVLAACDDISRAFHGEVKGHYRKLAAWEGGYDEFVYVDTDTILLRDLSFAYDLLDTYGFVTTTSNVPANTKWVWQQSVRGTGVLTAEQIEYAAGTQFIASRKECLRFAEVLPRMDAALALSGHMALVTLEMPLLNYLMVTSGRPYTSLRVLAGAEGGGEPPPGDIPQERWAGDPIGPVRDGRLVTPGSPPVFLVHWAGMWWELERGDRVELPHGDLWSYYRWLGDAGGHLADLP
ncbi:hypothetical protein [Micromonospora humidisoli]|uniref:Nucleotide-diphospho-sugar transferase n=1 Tax=Micromonospora humidisoli TaxID=2807622 RepID=A0ABS2JJ70_9ACTN|nr:hypothetical protein [Micromonospora humidisoli]MBM7086547.1 hypothetical protein [Micromonospora humidisoli]